MQDRVQGCALSAVTLTELPHLSEILFLSVQDRRKPQKICTWDMENSAVQRRGGMRALVWKWGHD